MLDNKKRQGRGSLQHVFDDLAPDELAAASTATADAGLFAARAFAVERLIDGPAAGLGRPATLVKLLIDRDEADPRWERLAPFEQRWALLVLRIVAPVMDPVAAVADARLRGATWAAIADALGGVTAQAAQQRFSSKLP